jgi:hypothetical protein
LRDDVKFPAALGKREDRSRAESGSPPSSGVATVATPEPASADRVVAGRLESAPAAGNELRSARPAAEAALAEPTARVMAAKVAPEQDRPPAWEGFAKEPPEKWLARIKELRSLGRAAEAEEMLSEFKRRFPEHPRAAGPR